MRRIGLLVDSTARLYRGEWSSGGYHKGVTSVLLTSLPRSGSTWVLNILQRADNVIPFHEPDHLDVIGAGEKGLHPYLADTGDVDRYYKVYQSIFKGRPYVPPSMSKSYLFHYFRVLQTYLPSGKIILIKSVYSILNTRWIYETFSPKIVILLRNPFSVAHSIHRKWPDARLKNLLVQKRLMQDYLEPYRSLMERARAPYEILAARIGACYKAILSDAESNPSWVVITHEKLCRDPMNEFRELYSRLGLRWSHNIGLLIQCKNRPKTSDRIAHTDRISSKEIDKWKNLLAPAEIKQIRGFYRPFNNPYYNEL